MVLGPAPSPKEDSGSRRGFAEKDPDEGGGKEKLPSPGQLSSRSEALIFNWDFFLSRNEKNFWPPRAAPAPHAPVTLAQPDLVPTLPVQDGAQLFSH